MIASKLENNGGVAISITDDTAIAFTGRTEAESRRAAQTYLDRLIPSWDCFNLRANPEKCGIISVTGDRERGHVYPTKREWEKAPVTIKGKKIPLVMPAARSAELNFCPSDVKATQTHLGLVIDPSQNFRARGIFSPELRLEGKFGEVTPEPNQSKLRPYLKNWRVVSNELRPAELSKMALEPGTLA